MPLSRSRQHVDARGLSCPMPIVKTAQAIKTARRPGALVEVLATDAGSVKDFAAWSRDDRQRARRADRRTAASTASSSAGSEAPS